MVEVLSGRSEIGKLRQKCDSYDENLELWKRKATALQKQCQDLNTVMRKYITDVKNRPQDKFTPIKITRSVGLQVSFTHHSLMHVSVYANQPILALRSLVIGSVCLLMELRQA